MRKYLYLQFKRMLKIFPYVLALAVILFSALMAVFSGVMQTINKGEDLKKVRIGIVGDTDHHYLDFALSAIQTMDETGLTMELQTLDEEEARKKLEEKDLSAYVVFPEGFMDAAMRGEIRTIKFVAASDAGGMVLIFKEEITRAVSQFLIESQKGAYGVQMALDANGYEELSQAYLDEAYVEYVDFVFHRSDIYEVRGLGISDGVGLFEYFLCGLLVILLMLMGLPYAGVFIKKDLSLNRILASRRLSSVKQVVCEYTAYTGVMLALSCLIIGVMALVASTGEFLGQLQGNGFVAMAAHILLIVVMIAAFNMMIFELSGNIVNGILLQFFTSLSLCYMTGCFYPIYTFPKTVQLISPFLPTGLARSYLACALTGENGMMDLLGILAYTVLFLCITIVVRRRRIAVGEV